MLTAITAGALLALLNVGHCASMCGPLSCAMCGRKAAALVRYQLGRLFGYALLGAVSGQLGHTLGISLRGSVSTWTLALLTASACVFSAWKLHAGSRPKLLPIRLGKSERPGLFAVLSRLVPREPLFLGALTAVLPCGVLASAVLAAIATGNGSAGVLLMLSFAAVSGSAVLGTGILAGPLAQRFDVRARRAVAYALVVLAALALIRPLGVLSAQPRTAAAHEIHCH